MDVFTLLRRDHENVSSIFKQIQHGFGLSDQPECRIQTAGERRILRFGIEMSEKDKLQSQKGVKIFKNECVA